MIFAIKKKRNIAVFKDLLILNLLLYLGGIQSQIILPYVVVILQRYLWENTGFLNFYAVFLITAIYRYTVLSMTI